MNRHHVKKTPIFLHETGYHVKKMPIFCRDCNFFLIFLHFLVDFFTKRRYNSPVNNKQHLHIMNLKKITRQKVNELTANMSNAEMRELLIANTRFSRGIIEASLGNATADEIRNELATVLSLWDVRKLLGEF